MDLFLCCDWGTSSFRLRLVDGRSFSVLAHTESAEGISRTFQSWKDQRKDQNDRFNFYLGKLASQIAVLAKKTPKSLDGVPVILSGMASSTIGMAEVPYARLPFPLEGHDASSRVYESSEDFPHQIVLVSGVRSDKDVMRGEETQVIGLFNLPELKLPEAGECVFILPGTHSKHIYIQDKKIADFQTYMTGELFNLLSGYSILKDSIAESSDPGLNDPAKAEAFRQGVRVSGEFSILHSLFTVRTNQLFNKLSKEQNFFYLSGLLIGVELRNLSQKDQGPLVVCSSKNLYDPYRSAVEEIGLKHASFVPPGTLDKATIAGQVKIFKELTKNSGK